MSDVSQMCSNIDGQYSESKSYVENTDVYSVIKSSKSTNFKQTAKIPEHQSNTVFCAPGYFLGVGLGLFPTDYISIV